MKRNDILKALAIIIIPGGIPVYLGYKLYQLTKKKEEKGERVKEQDNK